MSLNLNKILCFPYSLFSIDELTQLQIFPVQCLFLRQRRYKVLLGVNDQGSGWKMCTYYLYIVHVYEPACVLLNQINRVQKSKYARSIAFTLHKKVKSTL